MPPTLKKKKKKNYFERTGPYLTPFKVLNVGTDVYKPV